jgi:excinuclease UvrABC nuclease subunit
MKPQLTIPAMLLKTLDGFYVYAWVRENEYLYIGQTERLLARLGNHNVIGVTEAIQDGDTLEMYKCRSASEARSLEHDLIAQRHPRYNIEGHQDYKRQWQDVKSITKRAHPQRYRLQ